MARALLIALLAAAPLAGCSTSGATTPEEQVRAAAEAFVADCARDDLTAAQNILTEPAQQSFVEDGCARLLGTEDPAGTTVGAVTGLRGEQFATVTIAGADGSRRDLDLERRGELWYIASLTADASPRRRR